VTRLRKMMLEELQRRNYSESTIRGYLRAVQQFAKHFGKSPAQLGPDELRTYQAYLLKERKLAVGTVVARVAAFQAACGQLATGLEGSRRCASRIFSLNINPTFASGR
jgi:hypothetical protein